jgi:hypothetical protein
MTGKKGGEKTPGFGWVQPAFKNASFSLHALPVLKRARSKELITCYELTCDNTEDSFCFTKIFIVFISEISDQIPETIRSSPF